MANSNPSLDDSQRSRPTQNNLLRGLLIVAVVLAAAMVLMRFVRPNGTAEVYNPPPPPPKTVAQVEAQIKAVQNNPNIPASQKGMILGFLNADLQKAKAAQSTPPTK